MKFLQFAYKDRPEEVRAGYMVGNCVVDINGRDSRLPMTLLELMQKCLLERVIESKKERPCCMTNLSKVILKAPLYGMDKILCCGVNFRDMIVEGGYRTPKYPMFFRKFSSSIIGPDEPLRIRTDVTQKVDYEVELVIVVGKEATCVAPEDANDYVLGFTVANDISARDWQREKNCGQFLLSKSMDTFCPLGPWIVTMDELPDYRNLELKCRVNGVTAMRGNTRDMVYGIPEIFARLTSATTLYPGDIILCGSPAGKGAYHDPPLFLKPGDVVHTEIEKIGILETKVAEFHKPSPYTD